MDHEQVGKQIIIQSEIADKLNLYGFNPKEVGEIITGESTKIKKYLSQIIKSGLDADKLDFIKRDNFHSGAGYGNIDIERLVTTMEIHNDELAINMTALYTFELFILSRIKSFEAIYFHKTLRAAQILLLKALRITIDELGLLNNFNVYEYLNLDDYRLWYLISSSKDGGKILSRLESRDLIKCALEVKIIGKIDSKDFSKMIEEIKYEISKKANIDETLIYFDLSSLPSVPYHNAYEHDPYEIPVIKDDMIKKVYKLSDVSSWINNLKPLINIFRIYTEKEYKEKVYEASKNVLKNYSLFEELL
jgi:HD superfamily phosphohydrolases